MMKVDGELTRRNRMRNEMTKMFADQDDRVKYCEYKVQEFDDSVRNNQSTIKKIAYV